MRSILALATLSLLILTRTAQAETVIEVRSSEVETQSTQFLSYNFGPVPVNSIRYATYTVKNTGTSPLHFRSSTISGFEFSARHSCSGQLPPQGTCQFEIRYWPMWERWDSGRFFLDFEGSSIQVDLWGQGTRF